MIAPERPRWTEATRELVVTAGDQHFGDFGRPNAMGDTPCVCDAWWDRNDGPSWDEHLADVALGALADAGLLVTPQMSAVIEAAAAVVASWQQAAKSYLYPPEVALCAAVERFERPAGPWRFPGGQQPAPQQKACPEGFHWIGGGSDRCEKCDLPRRAHAGMASLREGAGPFGPDSDWVCQPWTDGETAG